MDAQTACWLILAHLWVHFGTLFGAFSFLATLDAITDAYFFGGGRTGGQPEEEGQAAASSSSLGPGAAS